MPEFPSEPVTAQHFFEEFVPASFSEFEIPDAAQAIEVKLGVRLDGEGGGEWLMSVAGGALSVAPGSREDAVLSLVTSVVDWRGALWEGRGGFVGRTAASLLRAGPGALSGVAGAAPAANPEALAQLASLDGIIRVVVTGGEGGDWSLGVKIGAGPIPEEPTTTVTLSSEDAEAMASGELDPMQAFMGGKILVAGDMTLMMQMGAVASMAMQGSSGGGD